MDSLAFYIWVIASYLILLSSLTLDDKILSFDKLDIILKDDIDKYILDVHPYIVEEIYLHKTVHKRQETYTLYIKSGE